MSKEEKILTKEIAEKFVADPESVRLDDFTSLDDDAARALARYKGWLKLDSLTTLSDEAAHALAEHRGDLSLNGLTEALANAFLGKRITLDVFNSESGEIIIWANRKITKTLLRKLAGVYNQVDMDPSPTRDKIFEIIGQHRQALDEVRREREKHPQPALAEVADRVIQSRECELHLNGLTSLSAGAARALAKHRAGQYFLGGLYLNGVANLSDEAAAALADYPGELVLGGLLALEATTGHVALSRKLAENEGPLVLASLQTLSDEAAEELSYATGKLSLGGLVELGDGSGHVALAGKLVDDARGHDPEGIDLDGLKYLSAKAAWELAEHRGDLYLNGLVTLSEAAAEALAAHRGRLFLNGLTTLSETAAMSLAAFQGEAVVAENLAQELSLVRITSSWSCFQSPGKLLPAGTVVVLPGVWGHASGGPTKSVDIKLTLKETTSLACALAALEEKAVKDLSDYGAEGLRRYYIEGVALYDDMAVFELGT